MATQEQTGSAHSGIRAAVTAELMQNYRAAQPFVPGGRVQTAYNAATGTTELFTESTSQSIVNVFADESSDTGWSTLDLQMKSTMFDAAAQADGSIIVYALDTTGKIQSNTKSAGNWQGWTEIAPPVLKSIYGFTLVSVVGVKAHRVEPSQPGGASDTFLSALCIVSGQGKYFHVPVHFDHKYSPTKITYFWGQLNVDAIDWCPALVAGDSWMAIHPGSFVTGNLDALPGGTQYFPAVLGPGIQQTGGGNGVFRLIDQGGTYTDMTATSGWGMSFGGTNGACFDELFAIRTNSLNKQQMPVHIHFDSLQFMFSARLLSDTEVSAIAARTINPGSDYRNELFGLGVDKNIYHMRQSDENREAWTPFLPIMPEEQALQFVGVDPGKNPALYSEAFAVTTTNELYHIWQGSADDPWHFDKVELPGTGETVEALDSYTVRVALFDAQNVPTIDADVKIYSETSTVLDINNQTVRIGPGRPWDCKTVADGQMTIVVPIDSMGPPQLSVWTTGMAADDRIAIDVSGATRARLAAVDGQTLVDAKVTANDGTQTALLTGTGVNAAPDLAKVVKESMAMAEDLTDDTHPDDRQFFHRMNDHRVGRYVRANDDRSVKTDPSKQSRTRQPWHVDFTGEHPTFTQLDRDTAQAMIKEQIALPSLHSKGLAATWGSFVDYIASGFATLKGWIVDGLRVVFTLVIDGVSFVYDLVVAYVGQTLDLLEIVFRAVKVVFDHLFRWLAHVFAWGDILLTQQAIEHLWNQMRLFLVGSIKKVRTFAEPNGPIDQYKNNVAKQFDEFINTILPPNYAMGGLSPNDMDEPTAGERAFQQSLGVNVVRDNVLHNASQEKLGTPAFTPTAELLQQTQALADKLESTAQSFHSSTAFTEALSYLKSIPDHPDQFLEMLAAALVKTVEGITLFALEAAQAIIIALCDAVLALMDGFWAIMLRPWNIPVVSELYRTHTEGKELTLLGALSLLVATPATVLYKMVYGKKIYPANSPTGAPFADADAVTAFKKAVTAQWMLQKAGFTATDQQTALIMPDVDVLTVAGELCSVCSVVNSAVYIPVDFLIDASTNPLTPSPGTSVLSKLALAHTWCDPAFNIPWVLGSEAGVGDGDAEEFSNLIWALQGIGIALDTYSYWRDQKVTRQILGGTGTIVASLWGGANIGLAIALAVKKDGDDKAGSAAAVLGTVPGGFKWVTEFPGRTTPPGAIMVLILLGLDVVCDASATSIAIAQLFTDD